MSSLCVVLVAPKQAGNIGSAARAMLNMGVSDLRIVAPRCDLQDSQARAMAVHAVELMDRARIYATLAEAVADCQVVVGTTARERKYGHAPLFPAEVRALLPASGLVALVFGREESGLTAEEFALCQHNIRIPTAEYASLNLAQAVLICCYELSQAGRVSNPEQPSSAATVAAWAVRDDHSPVAERATLEGFYQHLGQIMTETGYAEDQKLNHMLKRYRVIFDRAQLSQYEVGMLRGLWSQMLWRIGRADATAVAPSALDVNEQE